MPYQGEFAGYRSVRRLVGAEAVQQLLKRAKVAPPNASRNSPSPKRAPDPSIGGSGLRSRDRRQLQRSSSQERLPRCARWVLHCRQRANQLEVD